MAPSRRAADVLALRSAADWDDLAYGARAKLLRSVFALDPELPLVNSRWTSFAYFDGELCVASVDAGDLTLLVDGCEKRIGAIRLAAVAHEWRGAGLFRALMSQALAWLDAKVSALTMLYTEEQLLYSRFGFEPVAQHKFVGDAHSLASAVSVKRIDLKQSGDMAFVRRLLVTRSPVSLRCAVIGTDDLFVANMEANEDAVLVYAADLDALIAYEIDEAGLTLIDIVASKIPTMSAILAALALPCERVTTLFCSDRLGWDGTPVPDDTGLMARGPLPEAFSQPFMVPPTTEF